MYNKKEMGLRIAEIRRSHGMTQDQLSEMLDISPKHLSHAENGTNTLSLSVLIEFCNLFHCSLDYIILGSNDVAMSKLPPEIVSILNSGNEKKIDLLKRYLELYVELSTK